jgi:hypothetical protein
MNRSYKRRFAMPLLDKDIKTIPLNAPYKVHGNLNRGCLSVLPQGGKIQLHSNVCLIIDNVEFRVSAAGHKRILAKGREVVARFHGTIVDHVPATTNYFADDSQWVEISYNPIKYPDRPYFYRVDTGERVDGARRAIVISLDSMTTKAKTKAYILA